ncbi:hypothetical protein ACIQ7Q_24435 [Streptomyces sp. NPDC096176]|uniref:hypothetical protein n=1 Tax=Streptomyces sp. NPDC096176 TaxID=3366079 RepID=UPI0037F91B04
MYTFLSSSPDFVPEDEAAAKEAEKESAREIERYGVFTIDAFTAVPFAVLLKPPVT